jgi:hypothetical protein
MNKVVCKRLLSHTGRFLGICLVSYAIGSYLIDHEKLNSGLERFETDDQREQRVQRVQNVEDTEDTDEANKAEGAEDAGIVAILHMLYLTKS